MPVRTILHAGRKQYIASATAAEFRALIFPSPLYVESQQPTFPPAH